MSHLPSPSHVCSSCGGGFFDSERLAYHQTFCCTTEERQPYDSLAGLQAGQLVDAHNKRRKISLTSFLPLTLRSKDSDELSRKVPELTICVLRVPTSDDTSKIPGTSTSTQRSILTKPSIPSVKPTTSQAGADQTPSNAPRRDAEASDNRPIASRTRRGLHNLKAVGDQLPEPYSLNGSVFFAPAHSSYSRHMAFRNLPKPTLLQGKPNKFHLRRQYYNTSLPDHDPEESLGLQDLYNCKYHTREPPDHAVLGPFPNLSSFELGEWYINAGSQLSVKGLQKLVDIAQAPGFSDDIKQADWAKILGDLGSNKEDLPQLDKDSDQWMDDDGWERTPVAIPVPVKGSTEDHVVGTLYHRNIVSIVQEKIANSLDAHLFHHEPFEVLWQPDPSLPPTRVHSELYNSDAFLKAHRDLQDTPRPSGCHCPRVVVGLMFWSDATHMTSFSDEKLWPCYMGFANESKHRRCKPTLGLVHQIAYFDSLSTSFKDYVTKRGDGRYPSDPFTAHCKNEMMHAQWDIILDEELLDAIKNGIVIMCHDNIERRFYIRIFTYSADYPEKTLIATIRQRGDCPCPRCSVKMAEIDQMGTPEDMRRREQQARKDDAARRALVQDARKLLIPDDQKKGVAFGNGDVEALLKPQSLHAVENSFSKVSDIDSNFDIFSTLVVDLLHEFEIGVWKGLFTHIMRVVDACAPASSLLHELDTRIRLTPNFGKSIRRFSSNISKMTRKTARDYEDVLQCALPVFDSLIPDPLVQRSVVSIVDVCVRWHALAKLRLHTDETLQILEDTTVELGNEFRYFAYEVCHKIPTKELAAEQVKRIRREEKKVESDAKKAESDAKKAEAAAKKAEAAVKKAEATAKKAEAKATKEAELAVKRETRGKKKADTTATRPLAVGPGGSKANPVGSVTGKNKPRAENGSSKGRKDRDMASKEGNMTGLVDTNEPLDAGSLPSATAGASVPQAFGAPSDRPYDDPRVTIAFSSSSSALETPVGRYSTGPTSVDTIPSDGTTVDRSSSELSPSLASEDHTRPGASARTVTGPASENPKSDKRKAVKISISTPKFHFLGDYVKTIRFVGTTDNYSTELGELHHRSPKRWYHRSSKRNFRREVVRHERKVGRMRKLRHKLETSKNRNAKSIEDQRAAAQAADIHHYIAQDQNVPVLLTRFSERDPAADLGADSERDPLGERFLDQLREYLLPEVVAFAQRKHKEQLGGEDPALCMYGDKYPFDQSSVSFRSNRIYSHKIMRVKYTTYDVRRREDVLHVDSDVCNVMIPNPAFPENPEQPPYLHARLLGIYHANVAYMGEIGPGVRYLSPTRFEFLWVRRYSTSAIDSERLVPLDCVSLEPLSSLNSTQFINPDTVLRAAHIIPRFPSGKVHPDGRGTSAMGRDHSDWNQYYVNRYADRDMFMRYNIGMAVGHIGVWKNPPKRAVILPPHAARIPPAPSATSPSSEVPRPHSGSVESSHVTADISPETGGAIHETGEDGGDEEFELDSDMEVDNFAGADKDYDLDVEMYGY